MADTSKAFSCSIAAQTWSVLPGTTKCVLALSGVVTSTYSFSFQNCKVVTRSGKEISFEVAPASGFKALTVSGGNGPTVRVQVQDFPVTVSGTVTSNSSKLAVDVSDEAALGMKISQTQPPQAIAICYQKSVFYNDAGSDNDWNDIVFNVQAFSETTD